MSPCALNRYLVPAAMGGFAVALATGSGWLGWLGGALVAGVLWVRRDPAADATCAWSPPPADRGRDADLDVPLDAQDGAELPPVPTPPER